MKNKFDGFFIAGCVAIQTVLIYIVMATIEDNDYSFLGGFHLMAFIMAISMIVIINSVNSYLREHKD